MPSLSLSVINSVVGTFSSNIFLSSGSQSDQSMSSASGEMPASHPWLYSPEHIYSIRESSGRNTPCANPGGSQIHSASVLSRFAGISYAMIFPNVGEFFLISSAKSMR